MHKEVNKNSRKMPIASALVIFFYLCPIEMYKIELREIYDE